MDEDADELQDKLYIVDLSGHRTPSQKDVQIDYADVACQSLALKKPSLEVFYSCYDRFMKPVVYMMLGLPGSGKTTFSKELQAELGIKRLAIDEEYSRLGGNISSTDWNKELAAKAGKYIRKRTAELVSQSESVILDLCPWTKQRRDEYRAYIKSIGAEAHIYYFDIDKEKLLLRLTERNNSGGSHHIVTSETLNDYIQEFDIPLDEKIEIVKQ